jgi:hypothetical protein
MGIKKSKTIALSSRFALRSESFSTYTPNIIRAGQVLVLPSDSGIAGARFRPPGNKLLQPGAGFKQAQVIAAKTRLKSVVVRRSASTEA